MGTTLTAAYVGEQEVAIAHVGDSRAYRLRDGELVRLTDDHSLVEELLRQGRLTQEEAEEHPQRSIITRALGPERTVEVDTRSFRARAGDVYLLCSDGLTSMVAEHADRRCAARAPRLQRRRRGADRRRQRGRRARQRHRRAVPPRGGRRRGAGADRHRAGDDGRTAGGVRAGCRTAPAAGARRRAAAERRPRSPAPRARAPASAVRASRVRGERAGAARAPPPPARRAKRSRSRSWCSALIAAGACSRCSRSTSSAPTPRAGHVYNGLPTRSRAACAVQQHYVSGVTRRRSARTTAHAARPLAALGSATPPS